MFEHWGSWPVCTKVTLDAVQRAIEGTRLNTKGSEGVQERDGIVDGAGNGGEEVDLKQIWKQSIGISDSLDVGG